MELTSSTFQNGTAIPEETALCIPAEAEHVTMGPNRNPHLRWSNVPDGTRSFALICVDKDAPSVADDVNQEGKTVSADLDRVDFYHLVLVDIPTSVTEIPAGALSDGVTAKGKPFGKTEYGVQGINDYTTWFEGDPDMEGQYGGYDGPCPPWNDERIHEYHFMIFALDVESLNLSGAFSGADALQAMEDHVLGQGTLYGKYTLNPAVSIG